MTEALALGAKCLDDLDVARGDRAQEAMRGFGVPPPQTASRFLRRFCLGHIGQLNKALRQVLLGQVGADPSASRCTWVRWPSSGGTPPPHRAQRR